MKSLEEQLNTYGRERRPCLFILDFENQYPLIWPLDDVPEADVWYDLNGRTNVSAEPTVSTGFSFTKEPLPFAAFEEKFRYVHQELKNGNSFLTNLTARTRVHTSLGFQDIFQRSKARYKLWLSKSLLEKAGPPFQKEVLCFSPEIFVRIQDGLISSHPMKGTLDASLPNAREQLLADAKERFEHATIVDLIRNDLAQITTERWVERFRYVEEVPTHEKTLLQVSSEIKGRLPEDWQSQLGTLLLKVLPAGSITGAPKPKTVEIIQQAEQEPRGYYTGIVGMFDGENLDSGVLIRFLEQTNDGTFFRSGGGITFLSEAEKEYQELIDKVYLPFS
ncbi:aminodeoxychorismate synthase component I [Siphonobacter sp. BAB-5385]|uniref:aminodeoxychorismate synthase component I n=1 Tax=Siphonobacter sp. BAB-5385 TaxID=1864822 RepID=UPI000B9DF231|nr:aminodeoxychorismate synthase component I [Siphonobacter sp. BAB-5385]OZI10030.1 aminodeoxychorismate synthase component I [Siphonobacter sp. BAB-5385]